MSFDDIKALTFDTGGTILDWHTGFRISLEKLGKKYDVDCDFGSLANEIRRRSLRSMLNLGEHETPSYNFDDAHRRAVESVLDENGLEAATKEERRDIWWERMEEPRMNGAEAEGAI